MKHPLSWLSKTRQIQAASSSERGLRWAGWWGPAAELFTGWGSEAAREPSCGSDRCSFCAFPAVLPGIKGEGETFWAHSSAVAMLGSRGDLVRF